jgi:hypothetical protein
VCFFKNHLFPGNSQACDEALKDLGSLQKSSSFTFYSLFLLCHHDHLWVLVHLQVPEGEEHEDDSVSRSRQISNSDAKERDGERVSSFLT